MQGPISTPEQTIKAQHPSCSHSSGKKKSSFSPENLFKRDLVIRGN